MLSAPTGPNILSKSNFVRGCKCPKSLYLYKFHKDLQDEISDNQQALFDQGNETGMLARSLFPGGKDARVPYYDYAGSAKLTQKLLQNNCNSIYEAGFMFNDVY